MKKIAIIFTGGTISMTQAAPDGSAIPTLSGADIARSVPQLAGKFRLSNIDFGKFPGPHMTAERVVELRKAVEAALPEHDGVVVSHGTDTLEESAFQIDLFHTSEKPVVFVGAMRTSDEPSWDGPVNLLGACLVAASEHARGKGVMVVLDNTIHAASEVTKTFTHALDTFASPDAGPLGVIDLGEPVLYRSSIFRHRLAGTMLDSPPARVEMVVAHNGSDGTLVDSAVGAGFKGLVVQAFGRGNVPPGMYAALKKAAAAGTQVVICSQCWGGHTAPLYGYDGGGATLKSVGAIFCPALNGAKARIALSFLLGSGASRGQIERFFQKGAVQ